MPKSKHTIQNFYQALVTNNPELACQIIKDWERCDTKINFNEPINYSTCLIAAILNVQDPIQVISIVQYMLNKGADINLASVVFSVPESSAVSVSASVFAANYARGEKCGYTPLTAALRVKHLEIAQLLLFRGADVNKQDNSGAGIPFILAAESGDTQIMNAVLSANFNWDNVIGTGKPYELMRGLLEYECKNESEKQGYKEHYRCMFELMSLYKFFSKLKSEAQHFPNILGLDMAKSDNASINDAMFRDIFMMAFWVDKRNFGDAILNLRNLCETFRYVPNQPQIYIEEKSYFKMLLNQSCKLLQHIQAYYFKQIKALNLVCYILSKIETAQKGSGDGQILNFKTIVSGDQISVEPDFERLFQEAGSGFLQHVSIASSSSDTANKAQTQVQTQLYTQAQVQAQSDSLYPDVNAYDASGNTALLRLSSEISLKPNFLYETVLSVAYFLMMAGADANLRSRDGIRHPVIEAIKNKNVKLLALFLENGFDCNAIKKGQLPFVLAAEAGSMCMLFEMIYADKPLNFSLAYETTDVPGRSISGTPYQIMYQLYQQTIFPTSLNGSTVSTECSKIALELFAITHLILPQHYRIGKNIVAANLAIYMAFCIEKNLPSEATSIIDHLCRYANIPQFFIFDYDTRYEMSDCLNFIGKLQNLLDDELQKRIEGKLQSVKCNPVETKFIESDGGGELLKVLRELHKAVQRRIANKPAGLFDNIDCAPQSSSVRFSPNFARCFNVVEQAVTTSSSSSTTIPVKPAGGAATASDQVSTSKQTKLPSPMPLPMQVSDSCSEAQKQQPLAVDVDGKDKKKVSKKDAGKKAAKGMDQKGSKNRGRDESKGKGKGEGTSKEKERKVKMPEMQSSSTEPAKRVSPTSSSILYHQSWFSLIQSPDKFPLAQKRIVYLDMKQLLRRLFTEEQREVEEKVQDYMYKIPNSDIKIFNPMGEQKVHELQSYLTSLSGTVYIPLMDCGECGHWCLCVIKQCKMEIIDIGAQMKDGDKDGMINRSGYLTIQTLVREVAPKLISFNTEHPRFIEVVQIQAIRDAQDITQLRKIVADVLLQLMRNMRMLQSSFPTFFKKWPEFSDPATSLQNQSDVLVKH